MPSPTTTPADLRGLFETLVDDSIDVEIAYRLLTQAKDDIEVKLKLAILKAADASTTANPGDTYATLKAVPSDFREMLALYVGTIPYFPLGFTQAIIYRNTPRRYYIDYKKMVQAAACLGLTGAVGSAQTITQIYQVKTPAMTEANENTAGIVLWPDEFQNIIPYHVAMLKTGAIDADLETIKFNLSGRQEQEYQNLMDGLVAWDHNIKLAELNNERGYAPDVTYGDTPFDVGML